MLILLGFAATDFTLLKSLSLADALVHVLNEHVRVRHESAGQVVGFVKQCAAGCLGDEVAGYCNEQLIVAILLGIIGFIFWFLLRKGFNRNVLVLAVPLVGLYLLMTGVLIAGGAGSFISSRRSSRAGSITCSAASRRCRRLPTERTAGPEWRF